MSKVKLSLSVNSPKLIKLNSPNKIQRLSKLKIKIQVYAAQRKNIN